MTKQQWKKLLLSCAAIIIAINLPFIPGPGFLLIPAQIIYNFGWFALIAAIPVFFAGIIWTIRLLYKNNHQSKQKLYAFSMCLIPVAFFAAYRLAVISSGFSRNIAIDDASPLIAEIEKYKRRTGFYPSELNPTVSKINPSPIGIATYHYDKTDTSYTVSFTQNLMLGWNFEVVTYDPTDQHSRRRAKSAL